MKKMLESYNKAIRANRFRSPEISSGLVRIAHKINSQRSESQVIKIGDKYFRIRELG